MEQDYQYTIHFNFKKKCHWNKTIRKGKTLKVLPCQILCWASTVHELFTSRFCLFVCLLVRVVGWYLLLYLYTSPIAVVQWSTIAAIDSWWLAKFKKQNKNPELIKRISDYDPFWYFGYRVPWQMPLRCHRTEGQS